MVSDRLIIIDEFPYLTKASPELLSCAEQRPPTDPLVQLVGLDAIYGMSAA